MLQVIIIVQLLHDKFSNYCTRIWKYCQICIKTGQKLTIK